MDFEFIDNRKRPYILQVSKATYHDYSPLSTFSNLGVTYLVFVYGNIQYFDNHGVEQKLPKIYLKGAGDYCSLKGYENSYSIAFMLSTQAIFNATEKSASLFRNKLINVSRIINQDTLDLLYDQIGKSESLEEMEDIVYKYLSDDLRKWNFPSKTTPISNFILESKGHLDKKDLATKFDISDRTLERLFEKEIGTSPHNYIRLVKFNNLMKELQNPQNDLLNLMEKYGYYDRSHFEKEINIFLGMSYSDYLKEGKSLYEPVLSSAISYSEELIH